VEPGGAANQTVANSSASQRNSTTLFHDPAEICSQTICSIFPLGFSAHYKAKPPQIERFAAAERSFVFSRQSGNLAGFHKNGIVLLVIASAGIVGVIVKSTAFLARPRAADDQAANFNHIAQLKKILS